VPAPATTTRPTSPWLWALLAAAVAVNVVASAGVLPLGAGIAAGVVVLGCVAALVAARVRRR